MRKILFIFALVLVPIQTHAALDVAGWIPWWQEDEGIESAMDNIDELDVIYPFVFEVNMNGQLVDRAGIDEDNWEDLFDEARDEHVDILPSVMWFDGAQMHRILSDDDLREEHIEEIVDMVEDGDFDGVNIDYEGKLAETIDYFSEFLEELEDELGRKDLSCTVEARTRPEHIYRDVPEVIRYANDYEAMNKHCDWVEIMAYDQQRAILSMNERRKGEPYIPVADVDWVEMVLDLALEDFDEDKIMLGVPTYGRQWTLTVAKEWYKSYDSVGAINLPDALELADDYDVEPGRNAAGEMSYTFFPETSPFKILNVLPIPSDTRPGMEAAAKALLFANLTEMEVPVNVVWYSDAQAIADKIELAEDLDLRGIAIFKIDGEEDEDIWDEF